MADFVAAVVDSEKAANWKDACVQPIKDTRIQVGLCDFYTTISIVLNISMRYLLFFESDSRCYRNERT